jgi:hypothetical protein
MIEKTQGGTMKPPAKMPQTASAAPSAKNAGAQDGRVA